MKVAYDLHDEMNPSRLFASQTETRGDRPETPTASSSINAITPPKAERIPGQRCHGSSVEHEDCREATDKDKLMMKPLFVPEVTRVASADVVDVVVPKSPAISLPVTEDASVSRLAAQTTPDSRADVVVGLAAIGFGGGTESVLPRARRSPDLDLSEHGLELSERNPELSEHSQLSDDDSLSDDDRKPRRGRRVFYTVVILLVVSIAVAGTTLILGS